MFLNHRDADTFQANTANTLTTILSHEVPKSEVWRLSGIVPSSIKLPIKIQVTGEDLTGDSTYVMDVSSATPMARPPERIIDGSLEQGHNVKAYIFDDAGSPTAADEETIASVDYSAQTCTITVSAGNQTTGQTIELYYLPGGNAEVHCQVIPTTLPGNTLEVDFLTTTFARLHSKDQSNREASPLVFNKKAVALGQWSFRIQVKSSDVIQTSSLLDGLLDINLEVDDMDRNEINSRLALNPDSAIREVSQLVQRELGIVTPSPDGVTVAV